MSRIPNDVGWQNDIDNEDTALNQMFRSASADDRLKKPVNPFIGIGDLVRFQYTNWKNDPYPLVIVHDAHYVYPYNPSKGDHLRGINLNYLTMNTIVYMVQTFCGSGGFNYGQIVGRPEISRAFRTYKRMGIRMIKKWDCELLLKIIDGIRTQDPNQEKAIREEVERQLNRKVNETAEDLALRKNPFGIEETPPPATPTPLMGRNPPDLGWNPFGQGQ